MNVKSIVYSKKKFILLFLCVLSNVFVFGQLGGGASTCDIAEPICSSDELSFLNTSDDSTAEVGPDYGCLATQPNPAWFFLQIGNSGDIYLSIQQSNDLSGDPNLDVDFILYGPFTDPLDACETGLTSSNTVDCSYSPSGIEEATIENAVSGEFYMLLVTNFSGESGFITITQSFGDGSTNCSIIEGLIACDGESLELNAHTIDAETYVWFEEDPSNPESYILIAGENEEIFQAVNSNNYLAEVYDIGGSLLNVFEFNVEFLAVPDISEEIDPYVICDNFNENDGIGEFDLHSWDEEVLNGLDPALYNVSYFSTELDAESNDNELPNEYNNTLTPQTIFVRVNNVASSITECFSIGSFELIVNLKPQFELFDFFICTNTNGTEVINNSIIDTGLSDIDYSFEWTETSNPSVVLGTGSFFEPNQAGSYNVIVTDNATGCSTTLEDPNTTSVITESSPPINLTANVITQAFVGSNTIEATVNSSGTANFEFSLDNGPFDNNGTDSFLFTHVSPGIHTVIARDINGCGEESVSVLVVGYPLYFTPNNDGHNDTWQLIGMNNQLDAQIYIFDRYGKLLKQISPGGIGWDGTYNGEPLPQSDYWFSITYREPNESLDSAKKEFIAHFTLKR